MGLIEQQYNNGNKELHYKQEEAYIRAKKKVDKIVSFYWHLVTYLVINILIIGFSIYDLKPHTSIFGFHTFGTAMFWGIALFFHGFSVFGPDLFFGTTWEERKIKAYMKKHNNRY